MKLISTILTILFITASIIPAMASWEIKFGKAAGEVGFAQPVNEEDFPLGPHSFRLVNGTLWVADSVNGKIINFDKEGKLLQEIKIPGLDGQFFIDDFAVQLKEGKVESIWAAERFKTELIRFSADGKELGHIKGSGLVQLDQLAVASNGQLYVGDYGKALITVFDESGKKLREIPWQMSGFALDQADKLHMINFVEGSGHQHIVLDNQGKEIAKKAIGFAEMQNPRLWQVSAQGDIFVSFIPKSGDPTKNILVTIDEKGTILQKLNYINPYYISRYLLIDDSQAWLVKADYLKAPASTIKIENAGAIK
ncbi:MAG: hypothetical protein AB1403_13000 [Candidatus Riflebacteria bacterium]